MIHSLDDPNLKLSSSLWFNSLPDTIPMASIPGWRDASQCDCTGGLSVLEELAMVCSSGQLLPNGYGDTPSALPKYASRTELAFINKELA